MSFLQNLNKPLYISIFIYSIITIIIIYTKPKLLFHPDGRLKMTGCGSRKTIISFPIIIVLSSILIYFLVYYIYHLYSLKSSNIPKFPVFQKINNTFDPNKLSPSSLSRSLFNTNSIRQNPFNSNIF